MDIIKDLQNSIAIYEGMCSGDKDLDAYMIVAIESMKKQLPVEPFLDRDQGYIQCPACNWAIIYMDDPESHIHCLHCGQAFKWEGSDGN